MDALYREIKQMIIDSLDLEDITPDDIDAQAPLFGDGPGLGLDSIDALELGVALQRNFGITLAADAAESRAHFASVASLAALVAAHRAASEAV